MVIALSSFGGKDEYSSIPINTHHIYKVLVREVVPTSKYNKGKEE